MIVRVPRPCLVLSWEPDGSSSFETESSLVFFYGTLMHPLILTRVLGRVDPGVEFQDAILLVSRSPLVSSHSEGMKDTKANCHIPLGPCTTFFLIGLRSTRCSISRLSCYHQFPRIVSIITKVVVRGRSFSEGDVCERVEEGGCVGARCV